VLRTTASAAAVLLGAVLLAGCSKGPDYEVIFEAEGAGAAREISYLTPGESTPTAVKDATLPWTAGRVPATPGRILLEVTPAKGATATCRIVVEKAEVAKQVGQPGQKVTCEKVLTELPPNR
jgi:hypothetical protein